MSYSVTYATLPALTINSIGYTNGGTITSVVNNWSNSGPILLGQGVWLCIMHGYINSGTLGSNQGFMLTIDYTPNTTNPNYTSTASANPFGSIELSRVGCTVTGIFMNPPTLYFNIYTGPAASINVYSYSYTRLA